MVPVRANTNGRKALVSNGVVVFLLNKGYFIFDATTPGRGGIERETMKKKLILIFWIIVISSCNWYNKQGCNEEFRENLEYLEKYFLDNRGSYSTSEIEKRIEYLESQSGIKSADKGNILGKFIVTEKDIDRWEGWLNEQCRKKQLEKQREL
ncbi:hypothetical protein [Spongiimicrobium sp. 2-473A-2-J]|uniref:hypothetical protein n=1 Tax=Eudoraea algarum TaxID=3417568 RepID=UPI003D35A573